MKTTTFHLRGALLLFTACTMASTVAVHAASAQSASPVVVPGDGAPDATSTEQIQAIKVYYKKLLLKEKDIPNAVSHITHVEIEAAGSLGSVESVLKNTPSVNEYQSGPGQGVPVLTVRGERLYELSETLDGIPISDILDGGQGAFLSNNIGSPYVLNQLQDTTIYPGVAPPDDQGFGSGGGTVAYTTLDPSTEKSAVVFGSYGSFNTSDAGFTLNTGTMGNTDTGARAVLQYDQGYTDGFIDDTNTRNGNMLFKIVKPYDNGLSNISLTVIYNRGVGYANNQPIAVPLLDANSRSYNFPKSLSFYKEDNTYLTTLLHDETYVNPYLILSGTLFYERTAGTSTSYEDPSTIGYNPAFPYQITFQLPSIFGGSYGATAAANGEGPTAPWFTYDPFTAFAPAGSNPASVGYLVGSNPYAYGEAAEIINTVSNTIGFAPRANIFLPHNSITIGALIAKESQSGAAFVYGTPNMPEQEGYNALSFGGGVQRSVYQAFIQDKIDLLGDKLHFQPGVVVSSAYSSSVPGLNFSGLIYKLQNFNVIAEPYLGVSYDLPYHLTAYASTGKGGYFAPLSTYYPELNDNLPNPLQGLYAPRPEIIHLYEAGLRYDTSKLLVDADFFYQKVDDADSFFAYYGNGAVQFDTGNFGEQQFRGEELQTKFQATPTLDFFLNGSYNQATYLSSYFADDTPFEDQYGYVFKGDPLASVPKWLANFGLDYSWNNFGVRVDESFTGPQPITYDFPPVLPSSIPNVTVDPNCPQNSCLGLATVPATPNALKQLLGGPIPDVKQPSYLLTNLLLTYDLPLHYGAVTKLHFELNFQNLFDVHYYEHLYSSYAEFLDPNTSSGYAPTSPYLSAFEGPPRSIEFEMSAKF